MRASASAPGRGAVRERACGSADLLRLLAVPGREQEILASILRALPSRETAGLLERIAYHRIDGLAHRAVDLLPPEAIDPWLRSSLKRRHQRISAATLSQGLALAEVLEGLARRRLPVIVMRGLRSVEGIYGDPGSRPFEDHDLLVLPGDFDVAREVLARQGFEEAAPGLHRRGGVILDLHADPLGARRRPTRGAIFPLPTESLFERAAPGSVAGGPALVPSAEDELLLLAIHLVKHSFDRLIRVADLAHLLVARARTFDAEILRHRAVASRTTLLLGWALQAAAALGAPMAAEPGAAPGPLAAILMRRVLDLRPYPYTGEILMSLAAPTLKDRLRFALDAFLPSDAAPAVGAWRMAMAVPHRATALLRQAAWQAAERRRAR